MLSQGCGVQSSGEGTNTSKRVTCCDTRFGAALRCGLCYGKFVLTVDNVRHGDRCLLHRLGLRLGCRGGSVHVARSLVSTPDSVITKSINWCNYRNSRIRYIPNRESQTCTTNDHHHEGPSFFSVVSRRRHRLMLCVDFIQGRGGCTLSGGDPRRDCWFPRKLSSRLSTLVLPQSQMGCKFLIASNPLNPSHCPCYSTTALFLSHSKLWVSSHSPYQYASFKPNVKVSHSNAHNGTTLVNSRWTLQRAASTNV